MLGFKQELSALLHWLTMFSIQHYLSWNDRQEEEPPPPPRAHQP